MLTKRFLGNLLSKRLFSFQSSSFPSKYNTSKYQRQADAGAERHSKNDNILPKIIEKSAIKSAQDWSNVRKELLELEGVYGPVFKPASIDAMIVGACTSLKKYDLVSHYMNYLKSENIEPNLATLGKYFRVLYERNVGKKVSEDDEKTIISLYDNVRKTYGVLDSVTLDNVNQAISITKNWKLCLDLLEEIKISTSPTAFTYSIVVAAAFANGATEIAWKLLDEMLASEKSPNDVVYLAYLERVELEKDHLENLFNFLHLNELKLSAPVIAKLSNVGKKLAIQSYSTTIDSIGVCRNCRQKLHNFDLDENEFAELKAKIMQNVIVGRDVFNKTTPEELQKFQDFISTMKSFDVVIDGLNVAYSGPSHSHNPPSMSRMLSAVVSFFAQQKKSILVLGRNHMSYWPRQNWNYIQRNSTIFLTENLSYDDPYLLYCALNSGKNTIIVTKDLMRSHRFLLKSFHHQFLFTRWLSQRQYQLVRVDAKGKPLFKIPLPYSEMAQKVGDYWHLPYEEGEKSSKMPTRTNWICLKC